MLFRKYLTQRILKYSQRLFRKYNNSLTLLTLVQNFDSNDFEIKRNMLLSEYGHSTHKISQKDYFNSHFLTFS